MDYVISLLKGQQKAINRNIKSTVLMQKNMTSASKELSKVSELKRAMLNYSQYAERNGVEVEKAEKVFADIAEGFE